MTRQAHTSNVFIGLISLLIMLVSLNLVAAEQVVNIDGREILLKDDGTWAYASSDRFADTKDGQRVRLKQDGSWQYVGNAPLTSKQQVRTTELDLKLQKVVIETNEKKVQKNTRVRTQTVFYVGLGYSAQAKKHFSIKKTDSSLIEVKDNNGRVYPVLSIQADSAEVEPGTENTIVIRADKSPSIWDEVKSMQITFKPGIFGLQQPIILSQKIIDFENKKVAGFNKNN